MKRKTKFFILAIILGSALFLIYDFITLSLPELSGRGEFKQEFMSPTKKYVARSYLIDDGGATVAAQVRVGIYSMETSEFDDETIYWEIHLEDKENTKVIWMNDHIVSVNDRIINIYDPKSYYNWRQHPD